MEPRATGYEFTPHYGPSRRVRVPELDGLRGLAILLILLWHFAIAGNPVLDAFVPAPLAAVLRLSWSGVQLFFVLSGYLIGGILMDTRSSNSYFKSFYVRRAFRILPLYWLYLGTFSVGTMLFERGHLQRWYELFANRGPLTPFVLLVQNFWMAWSGRWGSSGLSVTWSLAVEEHFYLILPLIVRFLSIPRMVMTISIGIVAAPFLRTALMLGWPKGELAAYWLMPCHADSLGMGVLVAWMMRTPVVEQWVRAHLSALRILAVVLAFAVCGVAQVSPLVGSCSMTTVGYTLLSALFASALLCIVISPSGLFGQICRLRILRFCGIIAYGLYLVHLPIDIVMHGFVFGRPPRFTDLSSVMVSLAAMVISFGLATLSWRYIEEPLIRIGRLRTGPSSDARQPVP